MPAAARDLNNLQPPTEDQGKHGQTQTPQPAAGASILIRTVPPQSLRSPSAAPSDFGSDFCTAPRWLPLLPVTLLTPSSTLSTPSARRAYTGR